MRNNATWHKDDIEVIFLLGHPVYYIQNIEHKEDVLTKLV